MALACVWLMSGPQRVFVRTLPAPPDKLILYLNGVRLDPDNVFMIPWPSNRSELRASVENRALANYSNVWLSFTLPTRVTNLFTPGSWTLTDSTGPDRGNIAYYTLHDRYVLPPTVVRSFAPLSNFSNVFVFGGRIELASGTNTLVRSRFHFMFSTNLLDTVHLNGVLAENFLRQQAGTNYSPDLRMVGRE